MPEITKAEARFAHDFGVLLQCAARLSSAPLCPVCDRRTVLKDKDAFGTIHAECEKHGPFTLQAT